MIDISHYRRIRKERKKKGCKQKGMADFMFLHMHAKRKKKTETGKNIDKAKSSSI